MFPDGETNSPPFAVCIGTSEVLLEGVDAAVTGAVEPAFAVAAGVVEWPLPGPAPLGAWLGEHALTATVASKAMLTRSPRQFVILGMVPPFIEVSAFCGRTD
jgi:hypothetical protein